MPNLFHLLLDLKEFRHLDIAYLEKKMQGPKWNGQDICLKGLGEAVEDCFPKLVHEVN